MTNETKEPESWKYCSRCNLAPRVGCKGRSEYCETIPITEEMLKEMARQGWPDYIIEYARQHQNNTIALCYKEPNKSRLVYLMSKQEPSAEEADLAKKLVSVDQVPKTEKDLINRFLVKELEKSRRVAG